MLVLSRRTDESIVIGDDIVIRVLGIDRGGSVRLGIDAPRELRIMREELLTAIRNENRTAVPDRKDLAGLNGLAELMPQRQGQPDDKTPATNSAGS